MISICPFGGTAFGMGLRVRVRVWGGEVGICLLADSEVVRYLN